MLSLLMYNITIYLTVWTQIVNIITKTRMMDFAMLT